MQVITKVVHDVKTVADAVVAIPQLTDVPLHTRAAVDDPTQVSVNAIPIVALLGQAKADKINLDACQQVGVLKDQQLTAKDTEIAALKKKPSFWKRVTGTAKAVGIGVGIGLLLSSHL